MFIIKVLHDNFESVIPHRTRRVINSQNQFTGGRRPTARQTRFQYGYKVASYGITRSISDL